MHVGQTPNNLKYHHSSSTLVLLSYFTYENMSTQTPTKEEMRINWDGLCEYAASKNSGLPCTILPDKFGGGRHTVKLLRVNQDTF
jgi:hypothetical protein